MKTESVTNLPDAPRHQDTKDVSECEECEDTGYVVETEPDINPDGTPDFSHPIPVEYPCDDCQKGKTIQLEIEARRNIRDPDPDDIPF